MYELWLHHKMHGGRQTALDFYNNVYYSKHNCFKGQ